MGFPGDAGGKNLPAMQETQVPSLGREDPWRRKWQTTPVFLPRKFHGQRRATVHGVTKESDMTEHTHRTGHNPACLTPNGILVLRNAFP